MCKGEMAQLDSSLIAPIILLLNHFLGNMVTFFIQDLTLLTFNDFWRKFWPVLFWQPVHHFWQCRDFPVLGFLGFCCHFPLLGGSQDSPVGRSHLDNCRPPLVFKFMFILFIPRYFTLAIFIFVMLWYFTSFSYFSYLGISPFSFFALNS